MSAEPPVRPDAEKSSKEPPAGERDGVVLSAAEQRRRRTRNIAIGVTLAALVVLFYVMTLARLGSNVFDRPM
ncbi:hypothetical protein ACFQU1_19775 [Chelatococcus sp. GCM10030263]|uniref:hypothetical protein n=1 Tax=Chelatococcus sp. GCM10030263 TaxID=3273387 RepID=UPI00361D2E96